MADCDLRGNNAWLGVAKSDALGIHRDPTDYLQVGSIELREDRGEIERNLLTGNEAVTIEERVDGQYTSDGPLAYELHPELGLTVLKDFFPDYSVVQTGAETAYVHTFKGTGGCNKTGLSLTKSLSTQAWHYVGVTPNTVEFTFTTGETAKSNYEALGQKAVNYGVADMIGIAGTSQGQNAITFPVTLVASTSDQIQLDIDGAGAVEVTITAGTYSTAAALSEAINDAILGTSGLLTVVTERFPMVACYVDANDKLNFYSYSKGTSSSVAWTAGTNDAGTLLGRGVPVESAGLNTLAAPDFSTNYIKPMKPQNIRVYYGSTEFDASAATISVDLQSVKRELLGRDTNWGTNKGKRLVSGTITAMFKDRTHYNSFRNETDVALQIVADTGTTIDTSTTFKIIIDIPKARYGTTDPSVPDTGPISLEIPFKGYYKDATDKDFKITIQNSLATI